MDAVRQRDKIELSRKGAFILIQLIQIRPRTSVARLLAYSTSRNDGFHGNRREEREPQVEESEAKKKERRGREKSNWISPLFCLFGAKKKTRPRGERRRGRVDTLSEDGYLHLRRESFFSCPPCPIDSHARFSPFPLMNRKCELVSDARAPITEAMRARR